MAAGQLSDDATVHTSREAGQQLLETCDRFALHLDEEGTTQDVWDRCLICFSYTPEIEIT